LAVNYMGTSLWGACEEQGINALSSTSLQVAPLQHVHTPPRPCTWSFHQPHGLDVDHPQSTALITTINQIHHFAVSVIASIYTEPTPMKDAA
jgi:hypothetical protein